MDFKLFFLYKKCDKDEQIIVKYGTMVSNASFIGMLYASLFVLPQRILMWSYGISLYSQNKQEKSLKKSYYTLVLSLYSLELL